MDDLAALNWAYENDFEFYCRHNIKISVKAGEVIPFAWNEEQRYLYSKVQEQLKKQGYVRILLLKARQWGGSTWVVARGYSICSRRENHTGFVMAHQTSASNNVFGMAKIMHANDEVYAPETVKSNAKELFFKAPENSRLVVQTAPKTKGAGVGRSFTPRVLLCSEAAWWGEMGAHNMGGLMQAVPREYPGILGTEVYWETTANGYDPVFYSKWQEVEKAKSKGEPTEWEQVFIPWFWHKGYSHELDEEQRQYILDTLTAEEKWLLRQKRLDGSYVTVGQLSWRRQTIADGVPPPGLTKSQFFKQEYPATPNEAFQATGSRIFDLEKVNLLIEDAPAPIRRYEWLLSNGEPVATDNGRFLVWEEPEALRSYIVAADVAEGLEHGDFSCIKVIDHHTGEEVALWHGDIHPSDLGKLCYYIGKRYNWAWVGVERNNHGLTTITKLQELDYPSSRLYAEYAVDAPGAKPRKRYGWLTSKKTKPMMVDTLTLMVTEEPESTKDVETFREMLRFERHEDGTYGAQEGFNDDRLCATAIARELRRRLPTPKQQAAKVAENRRTNPPPQPAGNAGASQRWKAFVK